MDKTAAKPGLSFGLCFHSDRQNRAWRPRAQAKRRGKAAEAKTTEPEAAGAKPSEDLDEIDIALASLGIERQPSTDSSRRTGDSHTAIPTTSDCATCLSLLSKLLLHRQCQECRRCNLRCREGASGAAAAAPQQQPLLAVDSRHLKADDELRKMFGAAVRGPRWPASLSVRQGGRPRALALLGEAQMHSMPRKQLLGLISQSDLASR